MNILVTGGSSGLGKSIVNLLSSNKNNKIFFTYNSNKKEDYDGQNKFLNINKYYCNFNDNTSVVEFCNEIQNFDLDVLINNAYSGPALNKIFTRTNIDEIKDSFESNILSTILITKEVLKTFKLKKSGKIINILSSYLIGPPPIGTSIYTANKAYLSQLTKIWSKELIKFNITTNSISPEFMKTNFTKDIDERIVEQIKNNNPLKKLLKSEEIAQIIKWMINSTEHLNGVNIPVNAGQNLI